MRQIEENGGFLTEFWSTSVPDRENFLKRNRIIAGMSEATIVIESAEKGGSLVTADIAHSYNRDVFAVPGRTTDKYSVGCNNLIKQQRAHVLTSAADLIYLLSWKIDEKPQKEIQKQLFVELDTTEKEIYSYLQSNGKQLLDTVALECKLPVFKVSSTLLNMEMKGVIRPLPGKLAKRLFQHQEGFRLNKKNFTAKYQCRHLLYYEEFTWVHNAIAREKEIKGWLRVKKLDLIKTINPDLNFLEYLFPYQDSSLP